MYIDIYIYIYTYMYVRTYIYIFIHTYIYNRTLLNAYTRCAVIGKPGRARLNQTALPQWTLDL